MREPLITPRRIAVVEDDCEMREFISEFLRDAGYDARPIANSHELDDILCSEPIDLILLDLVLPGEDGLSVCRRISTRGGPGIIILSARGDELDRILGLEVGADDYISKPCSPREVLARVRAVLRRLEERRRSPSRGARSYAFEGFVFDARRRQLKAPDGTSLMLTHGELQLLNVFLEHSGRALARQELLELMAASADSSERIVDVQISRLRRKLHAYSDGELIRTVRGAGYLFDARVTRV